MPMKSPREPDLLLIGLRGSGKSTLARALARAERREAIDLDDVTLRALGASDASEAWRVHGEPAFRAAEAAGLAELLKSPRGRVVALGGGTPTAPGAAEAIREACATGGAVVVYLRATPQVLASRLRASGPGANRPSLTGAGPIEEIESVFAQRDPLYRRLATRTIEGVETVDDALRALSGWSGWAGA